MACAGKVKIAFLLRSANILARESCSSLLLLFVRTPQKVNGLTPSGRVELKYTSVKFKSTLACIYCHERSNSVRECFVVIHFITCNNYSSIIYFYQLAR